MNLPRTQRAPWSAVLLVALALVAVVVALRSGLQVQQYQGPSSLAVLPDQSVWVVLDDSLWHLDSSGAPLARVPVTQTGLGRPPASLIVHAGQELYALARGSDRVAVLHAHTARPLRQIVLAWPESQRRHLDGALFMAVHPDGRIAVANGGGHAVNLFAPDGRWLAGTVPGTYQFTNELWWDGDELWTTDTNGYALVRLSGDSLAVRERVPLSSQGRQRFTSLGVAHPRAGMERYAPLAVLGRMSSDMTHGRVTYFWRDGLEKDLDLGRDAEPRALAWQGDVLLVIEGRDMRLRRFDADRHALADLGSADVVRQLQQDRDGRARSQWLHRMGLSSAMLFLAAGIYMAWRARRSTRAQQQGATVAEARFLGTPVTPAMSRLNQGLQIFAPLSILALTLMLIAPLHVHVIAHWRGPVPPLALTGVLGTCWIIACVMMALTWMRHASAEARYEGTLNGLAVDWLLKTTSWNAVAQAGEHVRETLLIRRPGKVRWLVLTNRRLLSFLVNPLDRTLEAQWPRSDIASAVLLPAERVPLWQWLLSGAGASGAWLRIRLHDGHTLQGAVTSKVTAQRVQAQLTLVPPPKRRHGDDRPEPGENTRTITPRAVQQALASALLPGLGQWWQGRHGSALLLFVLFGGWMVAVTLPVTWALIRVSTHVSSLTIVMAFGLPLWLMLLSAHDAWRLRPRDA